MTDVAFLEAQVVRFEQWRRRTGLAAIGFALMFVLIHWTGEGVQPTPSTYVYASVVTLALACLSVLVRLWAAWRKLKAVVQLQRQRSLTPLL